MVGDAVVLEIPDSLMLRVAFRLYGIPMLLFVVCGLLGYQASVTFDFTPVELWSGLAALSGVVVSYLHQWRRSRAGSDAEFEVQMLRVCHDAMSPGGCSPH